MIKLSCGDGNFSVFIDPNAIQTIIDLGPPFTRTEITTSNKAIVVNESANEVMSLIRLAQVPFPDKSPNDSRVKPLEQINAEDIAEIAAHFIDCPSCATQLQFSPEGKNFPCERCGILWNTKNKP